MIRSFPNNSNIDTWNLLELCWLHEEQIKNNGSEEYIKSISKLIKEKYDKNLDNFIGEGCCSEYRNSVRLQEERLKEIIKEVE